MKIRLLYTSEVPEMKLVLAALKVVFREDVTTKITEILEELKPLTDDSVIQDIIRTVWHYLVDSATHIGATDEAENLLWDRLSTLSTTFSTWNREPSRLDGLMMASDLQPVSLDSGLRRNDEKMSKPFPKSNVRNLWA